MPILKRVSERLQTVGYGLGLPSRESFVSETYLTNMLDSIDRNPEIDRSSTGHYMHVSELARCKRKAVIDRLFNDGEPSYRTVSGYDRIVWRIGRAVEAHIRDGIIKGHGISKIWGAWTCPCGAKRFDGFFPTNDPICPQCKKERNIYIEPDLIDNVNGVVGHPDLTLVMPDGSFLVIEIKSMTSNDWKALEHAKGDHRFQACMYRSLYKSLGFNVHSKVIVIVATKDYSFKRSVSPYKEFHIDATLPELDRQLNESLKSAAMVKEFTKERKLPARSITCPNYDTPTAKNCSQCSLCFNLPEEEGSYV